MTEGESLRPVRDCRGIQLGMLNFLYETGEQFLRVREALNRLVPGQEERHQMLFASGGNSEPVPQPERGRCHQRVSQDIQRRVNSG